MGCSLQAYERDHIEMRYTQRGVPDLPWPMARALVLIPYWLHCFRRFKDDRWEGHRESHYVVDVQW